MLEVLLENSTFPTNLFMAVEVSCCCLVTKSCSTLCDIVDCSIPGFPVLHYLPEFAQTHVL